eukprot:TRINITY_DN4241_c1_g2_i2.p1 TRINITY_DN4241_c1_g2~~TRINITY_DN4241_c1_g2_i2.p1  ORF type:complete len:653 (+),score=217.82 TRINITY_DN4241_c1_g2_i2:59-2017(+)
MQCLCGADDALRGLKTAIAIHTELKRQQLDNSIGITTGLAFCGSVGSTSRQEYAMVGDIVNLASRLMGAAGKMGTGLLCDDTTYRSVSRRLIQFQHLEPIYVKGRAQAVDIHVPREHDRRIKSANEVHDQDEEAELIGRDPEIRALRAVLDQLVRERAGSITIIEGPAGSGKTALLRHMAATLTDLDGGYFSYFAQVVTGAAAAVEKNTPYFMWREVLEQLLYVDEDEDEDEGYAASEERELFQAESRLLEECDEHLHPFLPLLNPLLNMHLPETPLTRSFSNNQRHIHVANILLHLIQKRSRLRPLLLSLDNFQFVDDASLRLTYTLAKECSDTVALAIGTRRFPDPVPQLYRNIMSMPNTAKIKLKPLLPQDCLQVVCARLHIKQVPDELQEVIDKAEGNPFFASELVNAFVRSGVVVVKNGCASVDPDQRAALKDIPLSETVEAMVMSRVDRLPAGQQMVLKVASVIGVEFRKDMLKQIFPIADELEEISDNLRALVAEGAILKKVFSDKRYMKEEKGYFFKSDILQKVVYNRLLFQQRTQLHEAVARYLQGQVLSSIPSLRQVLHHWGKVLTSKAAIEERPGVLEKYIEHCCFLATRLREEDPDTCQAELDQVKAHAKALLELAGDAARPELADRLARGFRSVCFRDA